MPLAKDAVRSATEVAEVVKRVVAPLEKTLAVAETAPETITKERAEAIEALRGEVTRAIEFGRQERVEALEALTKQRQEALLELHRNISEERKALTQDLEAISLKAVDRALHRAARLTAVISVALCAWTVLLLFLTRRFFSANHSGAVKS